MLGDGESILAQGRQHWMALIRFALQPILVFIAAVLCLGIGMWLDPTGDGLFDQVIRWIDTLLGLFTAGLFILAVFWFPIQVVRWIKRRYLVTDRRVLYIEGVLRRNSRDAGLPMITDVSFQQTFLGRKMGYGDLNIATAANRPLDFRQMRDAISFKKVIMAAQQGTIQARADQILGKPATVPSVAAVAAIIDPSSVVPTEPVWDGSDVPQMTEDDLPPADPLIFGTAAAEQVVAEAAPEAAAAPEAVAEVEAAAEQVVAEAAPEAVADPVADAADVVPEAAVAAATDAVEAAPEAMAEVEAVPEPVAEAAPEAVADTVAGAGTGTEVEAEATRDAAPVGAESVTTALASAAALRDSGAITEAEFEAKKQELLDRISTSARSRGSCSAPVHHTEPSSERAKQQGPKRPRFDQFPTQIGDFVGRLPSVVSSRPTGPSLRGFGTPSAAGLPAVVSSEPMDRPARQWIPHRGSDRCDPRRSCSVLDACAHRAGPSARCRHSASLGYAPGAGENDAHPHRGDP